MQVRQLLMLWQKILPPAHVVKENRVKNLGPSLNLHTVTGRACHPTPEENHNWCSQNSVKKHQQMTILHAPPNATGYHWEHLQPKKLQSRFGIWRCCNKAWRKLSTTRYKRETAFHSIALVAVSTLLMYKHHPSLSHPLYLSTSQLHLPRLYLQKRKEELGHNFHHALHRS